MKEQSSLPVLCLLLIIIQQCLLIIAFAPSPPISLSSRRYTVNVNAPPIVILRSSTKSSSTDDAILRNDNKIIRPSSPDDEASIVSAEEEHQSTKLAIIKSSSSTKRKSSKVPIKRKLHLAWCNHDSCYEAIREKVVGEHNHMELTGPATGQVVYSWEKHFMAQEDDDNNEADDAEKVRNNNNNNNKVASPPAVLLLVKHHEEELLSIAAEAIERLTEMGVQILVDSTLREELENYEAIDFDVDNSDLIRLFDPKPVPGFGSGEQLLLDGTAAASATTKPNGSDTVSDGEEEEEQPSAGIQDPDLVVTLGGDGLLMYAAHVFSGPVPPILPVAGGSMGFLTPFAREEMLEAILISLGLLEDDDDENADADEGDIEDDTTNDSASAGLALSQRANNNMQIEPVDREAYNEKPPLAFGNNNQICISMRMRLDCRIFSSDGSLKSRFAVLNEVVIDRGSSPYLASLECFCDDVHLTTVQADGIIFGTPTGSTAYSMAAGGSVVHPAVPAILVTPICPHVLSFRSMVFPDHVVLRCYVPSDARSTACVHFDGKHRTELHRGDSVQIQMSAHPVPTINRADHSSDWLGSLKRNFNFNSRVRQNPL